MSARTPAAPSGRTIVRSGCWMAPLARSGEGPAHHVGALVVGQQLTDVVAGQDKQAHAALPGEDRPATGLPGRRGRGHDRRSV